MIHGISRGEEQLIFNELRVLLSRHYRLISRNRYQKAWQKWQEEVEAEEQCTEENCFRRIQEILQVERLFSLIVIREGKISQLNPTLVRLDDTIPERMNCVDCDTQTILANVRTLVANIVLSDLGIDTTAESREIKRIQSGTPSKIARPKGVVENNAQAQKRFKVTTTPLDLVSGGTIFQAEYFIDQNISAGIDYMSWEPNNVIDSWSFNFSWTHLKARYYTSKSEDGWYAGGGIARVIVDAKNHYRKKGVRKWCIQ